MADKVFRGTVILPDRMIENGYVLVGDGLVQSVGSGAMPEGEKHGGTDFFVFPGAIDAQVHSRSQLGQEDFVWSTRSAAASGVTTIVDMPYDDNCLIATGNVLSGRIQRCAQHLDNVWALHSFGGVSAAAWRGRRVGSCAKKACVCDDLCRCTYYVFVHVPNLAIESGTPIFQLERRT